MEKTNVIKLKYLRAGQPSGREYTFYTPAPVEVGDIVDIAVVSPDNTSQGMVTAVNVPLEEIEAFKDRAKTIIGKAAPKAEAENAAGCIRRSNMTRKTVMHRETEVFVVEERLAPRKEAIKRRVKLERCIAAGINLGAMILTGGALVKIGLMVFAVIDSRTGGLGGEVLVFPALAMMFLWGREIGLGEARQEAEAIEDNGGEY